jgi:hypothetical protein
MPCITLWQPPRIAQVMQLASIFLGGFDFIWGGGLEPPKPMPSYVPGVRQTDGHKLHPIKTADVSYVTLADSYMP